MTNAHNPALDAINLLSKPGRGATLMQFHERMLQVGAEVIATGKPGHVTIDFTLEHIKNTDELLIVLSAAVTHKMPKRPPETTQLWMGTDNLMHPNDTRADTLPGIREVVPERPAPEFVTREDLAPPERRAE